MMIVLLALYLVVVGTLVHKYHTWNVRSVIKVAVFMFPILTTMIALALTMIAGKITRTNTDKIGEMLVQASDMIEDILKDEA